MATIKKNQYFVAHAIVKTMHHEDYDIRVFKSRASIVSIR